MTSRAEYFRRQADVCLRLSLISSTEEVSTRLIVIAQEYNTKAAAIDAESKSLTAAAVQSISPGREEYNY